MKKDKKWIYSDPSVRLPYFLMKSVVWQDLSCAAQSLYCYMRLAMFDMENGYTNTNEAKVRFGPKDAPGFGHTKYYRALDELLKAGLVEQISFGGHGRKATFDMLSLEWVG